MSYVVKWVVSGKPPISTDHRIDHPSDAMDFACAVLDQKPDDIWVETMGGLTVADRQKIESHCKKRGIKN